MRQAQIADPPSKPGSAGGKLSFADEVSGKPASNPTVEHIVSVDEIIEMQGFKELGEFEKTGELSDAQKAVLSRGDNLIVMKRGDNSSTGNLTWALWKEGRPIYGDATADEMTGRERKLRDEILADIEGRIKTRRR